MCSCSWRVTLADHDEVTGVRRPCSCDGRLVACPHAASIDDHLLGQRSGVESLEVAVVDQQDHDVSPSHGRSRLAELDMGECREGWGKLVDVGFDGQQARAWESAGHLGGNLQGRRLAQIIDVGLEGQSEQADDRGPEPIRQGRNSFDDIARLAVVDLPGSTDESTLFGSRADDEPRVNGDAVSTDACLLYTSPSPRD